MRSFEADGKIITRNSSSESCGYFVFTDIPAYCPQNFLFGEAEAPFLHHLQFIPLHGRGEQLVDPTFGFLPLSIPSHV